MKVLVYNSVIVISQIDVIFFPVIITSGKKRFAKGASRVLNRWHLNLFTAGKCQFCVGTGNCGELSHFFRPYRGAFA